MRYLLIIFMLLTACGSDDSSTSFNPINPGDHTHKKKLELNQFSVYVDRFVSEAHDLGLQVEVNDLIIRFADIEQKRADENITTLGTCTTYHSGTPVIDIHEPSWEDLSDTSKEILLMHELGHCILKRGHVEDDSIMRAMLISDRDYVAHKGYYMSELFDPDTFSTMYLTHSNTCHH